MATYSESSVTLAKITFNGASTPSTYISVPGLKVGDLLVSCAEEGHAPGVTAFDMIIDTVDSIFQNADSEDYSARTFIGVIVRIP